MRGGAGVAAPRDSLRGEGTRGGGSLGGGSTGTTGGSCGDDNSPEWLGAGAGSGTGEVVPGI